MANPDNSNAELIQPSAFEPLGATQQKPPRQANTRRWLLLASALLAFELVVQIPFVGPSVLQAVAVMDF